MAAEAGTFYFNDGARRVHPLRMQFADGEHAVPGWVVAAIGEEELKANAAAFAQLTLEEFSASFSQQMASEHMARVQSSFVVAHFGGFRS